MALLDKQHAESASNWEGRYILLLWLSSIILIPFSLNTIYSESTNGGIIAKLLAISDTYLNNPGKSSEAAGLLVARVLTRPDYSSSELNAFFDRGLETLAVSKDPFLVSGILMAFSAIYKRGKREELLRNSSQLWNRLKECNLGNSNSVVHRKLFFKLSQRIGLVFLKPVIASWRYQRGSRSLKSNLGKAPVIATPEISQEEEDFDEIPEEVEDIIGVLLSGLRDKDTVVRWSSAKGIGRVTSRLPKEFGDEVIGSVLGCFEIGESDSSWHGGCLATAELARRGLLLPQRLDEVIPLLLKALQFDERRGAHSVGSHVRDAACYVAWAFGRAYHPSVMQPYVQSIACNLMVVALLDRELPIRRAAAAAFQENVGRQGNFPHGIDIVTAADYFSLSNRNEAFTTVLTSVARFDEYRMPLIDHLVDVKIQHWDKSIRELSGKSLGCILSTDTEKYVFTNALPKLIRGTTSTDLNLRHGSIMAIAEILRASADLNLKLEIQLENEISQIIPTIERERLYRGKGGEWIRFAACNLIHGVAYAKIPLTTPAPTVQDVPTDPKKIPKIPTKQKATGVIYQESIDENICHPNEDVQLEAVTALRKFTENCYSHPPKKAAFDLVDRYILKLENDHNPASRRGFGLALGNFPADFYSQKLQKVVELLLFSTTIETNPHHRDAEARRNAIIGLSQLTKTVKIGENGLNLELSKKILNGMLESMRDFSVDNRGDVGSWVREASMKAIVPLVQQLVQVGGEFWTEEDCTSVIQGLLQQSMEKIDRIREISGKSLHDLLYSDPEIPKIPHRAELEKIFPRDSTGPWSNSNAMFPQLIQLIHLKEFREPILLGLVPSLGGVTSSLVLDSTDNVLSEFLETADIKMRHVIAGKLVEIYAKFHTLDRVTVPMLKVFSHLLSHGIFDQLQFPEYEWSMELLNAVKEHIKGTKDIVKIMSSIYVFCWLLLFQEPTRTASLKTLLSFLGNRYPKVRKLTAEEFYARILTDGELINVNGKIKVDNDAVISILSEHVWDAEMHPGLKEAREKLYKLFQVEMPKLIKATATPNSPVPRDPKEKDEYKGLGREKGY
eukprot:TRINITY_DN3884_c2_g1_i1.p1 TRINITY_DN3884_c2_g1~~TRINITY_DN3884_c2_g1_i1.p1  ORF type:complete len:1072 (-),score=395.86 TRINITY_DN3884_c2_g1_i1:58-3273(-)